MSEPTLKSITITFKRGEFFVEELSKREILEALRLDIMDQIEDYLNDEEIEVSYELSN